MNDPRQRLIDRARFVFALPETRTTLAAMVGLGILTGGVAIGATPRGAAAGFVVLTVPAIVAAAGTNPVAHARSDGISTGYSAFLAFAASAIVATFVVVAVGVQSVVGGGTDLVVAAVLTGTAGTFAFRLFVLVAVSGPPLADRLRPAAVQPVAIVATVVVAALLTDRQPITGTELIVTVLVTVLYGAIAVGLVALVERPMRRELGISGFEFLHQFLTYVGGRSTNLESVLASLGERAEVPISVLGIRTLDGEEKARVVVPLAHPGPISGVGGSTLPYRLAEDGDGLVFTPHGLAGHAYDPVSQRDVDDLCAAASLAMNDIEYERWATPPTRVRAGGASVSGQRFAGGSFLVTTFAPEATDDVAQSVGLDALTVGTSGDAPLVTDAHNSCPTDTSDGRTRAGSARAEALLDAVARASSSLDCASRDELRVGVAADPTPYGVEDGIGPLGVRVLATAVGDSTAASVLVDGNNMVPWLRRRIRDAVRDAVPSIDVVSVSTTDSHAVNHLNSMNYVGMAVNESAFATLVADVAVAAIEDLEPVEAGTATTTATVTVLGEGTIEEIAELTDRILPRSGAFVLVSSVFVTLVAGILFWLTYA